MQLLTASMQQSSASSVSQQCLHKDCDNAADLNAYVAQVKANADHSSCMDGSNTLSSDMPGIALSMAVGVGVQCPTASAAVHSSGAAAPTATASGADSHVLPLVSLASLLCAWADL
jgi:hypothetical protein